MKNLIYGIAIGLAVGLCISVAYAKFESGSSDAKSIVGYGHNGGNIIRLLVTTDGRLEVSQ